MKMQQLEDSSTPKSVGLGIVGYSLCSSTLLFANKKAIAYLPFPSVISFIQMIFTAITVLLMKYYIGVKVDNLEWSKVKAYFIYIIVFVSAMHTSMQTLQHSKLETVIALRACSLISVSIVEWLFLGRELPCRRSAASLTMVALGAVAYYTTGTQFDLEGTSEFIWAIACFLLLTLEMTYGKKLISSVQMDSVWGPVLYCNLLAAFPMFLVGYSNGDYEFLSEFIVEMPAGGVALLLFSCVAGTLMAYTGWLCRGMISATSYTLIGVINKFGTILLGVVVWGQHVSGERIAAVCLFLLSGAFYQQPPKRVVSAARPMQVQSDIELPLDRCESEDSTDRDRLLSGADER